MFRWFLNRVSSDRGVKLSIQGPEYDDLIDTIKNDYRLKEIDRDKTRCVMESENDYQLEISPGKDDELALIFTFNKYTELPEFTMIKRDELNQAQLEQRSLQELFFGSKRLDRMYHFSGDLKSDFATNLRAQQGLFNRLKTSIKRVHTYENKLIIELLLSIRSVNDIISTLIPKILENN